ncbi:DUF6497 family protein [uncultured Roseobacter sp.]|uniref:DUF6497 family protein n=1 Tax=uncultured Roseobacter sp. TaxID=114847 RepID=UPI002632758A|nr:DUF6497 family protein [uncultured Roseobacter sp.]
MSVALQNRPAIADSVLRIAGDLPSGQAVELFEVLIDQVGDDAWLRFRFLAPAIARAGGTVTFAQAEADFEHLCTNVALPYMAEHRLTADVVSVAMLDQPAPFGATDDSVTQYVDAFRVSSGTCIWEDPW